MRQVIDQQIRSDEEIRESHHYLVVAACHHLGRLQEQRSQDLAAPELTELCRSWRFKICVRHLK